MVETISARDGAGLRVAVIASRFNRMITDRLVAGAMEALRQHGTDEAHVTLTWVPGAFEIPVAFKHLVAQKRHDAYVIVGAVIRGETPHFDVVVGQVTAGVRDISLEYMTPLGFGLLTTETEEQASSRAGGKLGNKGYEAAVVAIEMANLLRQKAV